MQVDDSRNPRTLTNVLIKVSHDGVVHLYALASAHVHARTHTHTNTQTGLHTVKMKADSLSFGSLDPFFVSVVYFLWFKWVPIMR